MTNVWFYERAGEPARAWLSRRGSLAAYLAGCRLCLSVWVAAVCAATWAYGGVPGRIVVTAFAASAGALFFDTVWGWFLRPTNSSGG